MAKELGQDSGVGAIGYALEQVTLADLRGVAEEYDLSVETLDDGFSQVEVSRFGDSPLVAVRAGELAVALACVVAAITTMERAAQGE